MLDRVIELASAAADDWELFLEERAATDVAFRAGELRTIDAVRLSGVALRLARGGRMGGSYARELRSPETLVEGARRALAAGAETPTGFAGRASYQVGRVAGRPAGGEELVAAGEEALQRLRDATPGADLVAYVSSRHRTVRVLTRGGVDERLALARADLVAGYAFPGGSTGVYQALATDGAAPRLDAATAGLLARLHAAAGRTVPAPTGLGPVLFLPRALKAFAWRLAVGTCGRTVVRRESPLAGRVGALVASRAFSLADDPHGGLDARVFDDEGTPTARTPLVEDGTLRGFYYDRFWAAQAGQASTGHGYRDELGYGAGDAVAHAVAPVPQHLAIAPGRRTLEELVRAMGRGVVLVDAIGAHSGNIPNGDFAVGMAPAFVVEGGEIVGRVRDGMVAGNVYDLLPRVVEAGNVVEATRFGRFPALLVDGVRVTG
jgi:PmbA protein